MSVQTSSHYCGGVLVFVRDPDGSSYERCLSCGWLYSFGVGQTAEVVRAQSARSGRDG